MRPLVVTGTERGISHAPLLEIPQGNGVWLLCQLQVVSKMDVEPMARWLLERMIRYLADYAPPTGATLCLGPPSLQEALTRLSVDWLPLRNWGALRWPQVKVLILQADGGTIARHADRLRAFIEEGGQVLWHRPATDGFEAARAALHLPVVLQVYRGPVLRAEGESPLLEALTREDLYWLQGPQGRGRPPTPLASDVAEGVFVQQVEMRGGRTFEAERDVELEGTIVEAREEDILFASNGRAHWRLHLPEDGVYTLGLVARGTPVGGVYPMAAVYLDDARLGVLYIGSERWRTYSLTWRAKAGPHRLTVAFINDANAPPEDRNLYLDRFVLTRTRGAKKLEALTTPAALVRWPMGKGALILSAIRWDEARQNAQRGQRFLCSLLTALGARFRGARRGDILEAEALEPQSRLAWFRREADHVYMGTNGYIEGRVRIVRAGRYRVFVWGKGTSAEGEYPLIALELDGREVGRVEIKSDDWAPHLLTAVLPAGEHTLRVRFLNDLWRPPEDRNLWLDKLEFERMREEG
jgi:hypothetical protein